MWKRLIVILTFIGFVAYHESGLYPNNSGFETLPERELITAVEPISTPEAIPPPEPEEISEPESLPESELIRALQEIPYLENFLVGTTPTTNKTEYALEDNFWMILGPLVLSLITIVFCLMMYFHRQRVSNREDETTQEPSQSTMLLHQWESEMLEWRGKLARMQESELLRDQFQNEMKSLKMIVKTQDESLIQILGELDSLKMTVKTRDESLIPLLSKIDSVRKM
jgi:hypothetical protein